MKVFEWNLKDVNNGLFMICFCRDSPLNFQNVCIILLFLNYGLLASTSFDHYHQKLWKAPGLQWRKTKGNKTFHEIIIILSCSAVDGIYCARGLGRNIKGLWKSLSSSKDFYSYREIDLILLFMMRIFVTLPINWYLLPGCWENLCIYCRMGILMLCCFRGCFCSVSIFNLEFSVMIYMETTFLE